MALPHPDVAHTATNSDPGTGATLTIAESVGTLTAGQRLIVVTCSFQSTTGHSADTQDCGTPTQSAGTATVGTWTHDAAAPAARDTDGGTFLSVWSAPVTASGTCTVSVTLTPATGNINDAGLGWSAGAFPGLDSSGTPVDVKSTGNGYPYPSAVVNPDTTNTASTGAAGELALAFGADWGSGVSWDVTGTGQTLGTNGFGLEAGLNGNNGSGSAPFVVVASKLTAGGTAEGGKWHVATTVFNFQGAIAVVYKKSSAVSATATPSVVADTVTVPAPTVSVGSTLTTTAIHAVATVPTPTVVAGVNTTVTPNPATAVVTVFAPTVGGNVTITATAIAAVATVPAPTVQRNAVITPAAIAAVATVPAPTVFTGLSATATPSAIAAIATVPAPAITTGSAVTVTPAAATATVTVPALGGTVSQILTPAAVADLATVPAPTVGQNVTATPAAATAVATVPAPTIFTGTTVNITPGPAVAVAAFPAPAITSITGTFATPVPALAFVTFPAPVIFAGHSATALPATINVVVVVHAPISFGPVQDLYFTVGRPVDRWFVADPCYRWAAGHRTPRWNAAPTVARWTIPAHGRLTMSQTLSTASLEYVRVPVTVSKSGSAYDPSGDAVAMAFQATPAAPSLFYNGAWETTGTTFFALCLVGPGGVVQLSPGTWYVWVKITDAPEIPVLDAGVILVR